jgi:biopolymer transport protein ExbD
MGGDVSGSSSAKSEPNVVPLCDILLVLLIIFMVVTPIIQKGANVKLPEATNVETWSDSDKGIVVHIQKDGTVYLGDKEVLDIEKLPTLIEDKLEESNSEEKGKVLLKADGEAAYGRVTAVMDKIRRAQIEMVGLVTDKATSD